MRIQFQCEKVRKRIIDIKLAYHNTELIQEKHKE